MSTDRTSHYPGSKHTNVSVIGTASSADPYVLTESKRSADHDPLLHTDQRTILEVLLGRDLQGSDRYDAYPSQEILFMDSANPHDRSSIASKTHSSGYSKSSTKSTINPDVSIEQSFTSGPAGRRRDHQVLDTGALYPTISTCGHWAFIFNDTVDSRSIDWASTSPANIKSQARSQLGATLVAYDFHRQALDNDSDGDQITDFRRLYEWLDPRFKVPESRATVHIAPYVWKTLFDYLEKHSVDLVSHHESGSDCRDVEQREATLEGLWTFVRGLNVFVDEYINVPIRPEGLLHIKHLSGGGGVIIPTWVRDLATGKRRESTNTGDTKDGADTSMSSVPHQDLQSW